MFSSSKKCGIWGKSSRFWGILTSHFNCTFRHSCYCTFSKWQTKDQPVVAEVALAAVVDAVGVVPGGDQEEESLKIKMYVPNSS